MYNRGRSWSKGCKRVWCGWKIQLLDLLQHSRKDGDVTKSSCSKAIRHGQLFFWGPLSPCTCCQANDLGLGRQYIYGVRALRLCGLAVPHRKSFASFLCTSTGV
jgi:hypothetical protein